ncbi:hypothetical protein J6590_093197 [Homalodisca vitripennis]|nr:hypothetical protein J6590_093197 [Homalodisca vitripennis]
MEEETVVIQTKLGQLRGLVKHSVLNDKTFYAFLGIPFGKPPLGDLRCTFNISSGSARRTSDDTDTDSTPDSCYVLIAGTSDLTAEKQNNIHPHLELCFTGKLKTAKVIISNSAPPTRPASCPSSKKGNSSSQCL